MRVRLRSSAIIIFVLGLAALLVYAGPSLLYFVFYLGPDSSHRTDDQMRATFMAREQDFESLREMFKADSAFERIAAPTYVILHSRPPAARQERYELFMNRLGVWSIEREGPDLLVLRATTTHTFDRKGYVWSRHALPIVGHETTRMTRDEQYRGVFRVFRPLKDGWYIYFQPNS